MIVSEENIYNKQPIIIKTLKYHDKKFYVDKNYILSGKSPAPVINAIKNYNTNPNDELLNNWYGPIYKNLIELYHGIKVGSYDDEEDDIDLLLQSNTIIPEILNEETVKTQISNVTIYPEDNFSEIKEKIQIITGIPTYRQHVWYAKKDIVVSTYKLLIGQTEIYKFINYINSFDIVDNIHIDTVIFDKRAQLQIQAYDSFLLAENELNSNINYLCVVDLAFFIHPSMPSFKRLLKDTHLFELIYYGFVVIYWPQLTLECFKDYIISESDLYIKYPDLAKDTKTLEQKIKLESEALDYVYQNYELAKKYESEILFSITNITVNIKSITQINIRNLFDKLKTSKLYPEIRGRFSVNQKNFYARKHAIYASNIQFPPSKTMSTGLIIVIKPDNYHPIFVNLLSDGTMSTRITMNEEDKADYNVIINHIITWVNPLILYINSFKRLVTYKGVLSLYTLNNFTCNEINVFLYWKKLMSNSTFKQVIQQFDLFIKSGIIMMRGIHNWEKREFIIRKAMFEYDSKIIEKILLVSSNVLLSNQYAHLSDNIVKQKWDQNYSGHPVKIMHRTSDIRAEITNIKEKEFAHFYRYFLIFIYRVHKQKIIPATYTISDSTNNLKRLKEQDPELFNLKKHNGKKVYSIVCQHLRQPYILTPEEVSSTAHKVSKFWNFTQEKPAFYTCPNSKYPHLNFIAGSHPKGYCLPCCSKRDYNDPQNKTESHKKDVNEKCIKDFVVGRSHNLISKHVLSYGKYVDIGRLSSLPIRLTELLNHSKLVDYTEYLALGVQQTLPAADVGLLFSVAEALDKNIMDLIEPITQALREDSMLFQTILDGSLGAIFYNNENFIATIESIFLSINTIDAIYYDKWNEFFYEIFSIVFEVNIFIFIENGSVELYSDFNSYNSAYSSIILLKSQNTFYPIFLYNAREFAKTTEPLQKMFSNDHPIIILFTKLLNTRPIQTNKMPSLESISQVADFKIVTKFANKNNLCWAVILKRGKEYVFVPCDYSAGANTYSAPKREDYNLTWNALSDFVNKYNKLPEVIRGDYQSLVFTKRAVLNGKTSHVSVQNNAMFALNLGEKIDINLPEINIPYDLFIINEQIINKTAPVSDPRIERIGAAIYKSYGYRLFFIEFIYYLNSERNTELRTKLSSLLTEQTDFQQQNTEIIRMFLTDALPPSSYKIFSDEFDYYLKNSIDAIQVINQNRFSFDSISEHLLKSKSKNNAPHSEICSEIRALTAHFVIEKDIELRNFNFTNIIQSCNEIQAPYCETNKLILSKKDLNDYISILAAEILNPLKREFIFNSSWVSNIIDKQSFERVINETIQITPIDN